MRNKISYTKALIQQRGICEDATKIIAQQIAQMEFYRKTAIKTLTNIYQNPKRKPDTNIINEQRPLFS